MLIRTPSEPGVAATAVPSRPRDPRLDFFRGIGMFIILVAHIPSNGWTLWIPARFGFSDATEMFVFLSGMASAIAFGKVFDRDGFAMGTARVAVRVWQVYWAHIAVFLVIATMMYVAGMRPDGREPYYASLNLRAFFTDPGPLLVGLFSLTYVPNYFDILPMYLVILGLLPVMILAERTGGGLMAAALMLGLWGLAQARLLDLPAEPWSQRPWFFNPFGWQLIFFTGFFLMRRRFPSPPPSRWLTGLALAVVIAAVPLSWYKAHQTFPVLLDAARALKPLTAKTEFGFLRYLHFLALAYLAVQLVGDGGRRLRGAAVRVISLVGQQSLAVFVTGMVAAQALGLLLDRTGRDALSEAVANLLGFALLIAVAHAVGWLKSAPWKG